MDTGRLRGEVAIVTGGGGAGMGRSTCLRLAAEGASVVAADVDLTSAQQVAEEVIGAGGQALAVETDVSDAGSVHALVATTVEAFGGLDILHNNAAALSPDVLGSDLELIDLDRATFDRSVAVNMLGPLLCCKTAIPHMLERGGGAIVNTSSTAAFRGMSRFPIYAMTKAALHTLTLYVAERYGKQGIRCNTIAPSSIITPGWAAHNPPERLAVVADPLMLGRAGSPEDIASAVAFLVSEDAAFITGQLLFLDGGRLARA